MYHIKGYSNDKLYYKKERDEIFLHWALDSKWKTGNWVGMTNRSNEQIVIIPDGDNDYAIRVRTVIRMSSESRWSHKAIQRITVTAKTPVPERKTESAVIEPPVVYADAGGDGTNLPAEGVGCNGMVTRDFKITKQALETYGLSDHCPGCEAALQGKRGRNVLPCLEGPYQILHTVKKRL